MAQLSPEAQKYLNAGGTLTNGQIPTMYAATGAETKPISVSSLTTPQTPINVQPMPNLSTPENLGNFDVKSILTDLQKQTESQTAQDTAMSNTSSLYQKLFGKSQDKQAAETAAGLPDKNKQLTEAVNRFRTTTAEQNQLIQEQGVIPLALQEQFAGTGATRGGVEPIQAAELRKNAIKQYQVTSKGLFQQAEIANIRDDIAGAQAAVDKAIEYKYAPIEQELNYYKEFVLPTLKDRVTGERADKLKELELQVNERTRLLNNAREDSKIGSELALTAMKLFPNDKQAQYNAQLAMQEAQKEQPDINKIVSLVGNYQVDPVAIKTALLQQEQIRAQTAKAYSDMALSKKELELKYATQASNTVVDPITGKPSSELKVNARQAASTLLDKFTKGIGTSAVGGSRILGLQYIPGTKATDFKVQFDNLKSLLSLDNVKLLKGQGQVSDAERALLAAASSNLQLDQSEQEFRANLVKISIGLGNPQLVTLTDRNGVSQQVPVDANTLNKAISDGLTVTY